MKKSSTRNILIAIAVLYISLSFFAGSIIDEDAFIYFRFAENIINGSGCVFNAGAEKIEACSSVTWLCLLVFLGWAGCDLVIAAKLLGIVTGVLSLAVLFLLSRRLGLRMPWSIVPSLLTACTLPCIMWNQMGLETPLYTVVLLVLVVVSVDRKLFHYWPFAAAALIITRPEGFFLLLGLLPAFYYYRRDRRLLLRSSILFLCLVVIMGAARFIYFHDFLPNSFYHKVYAGKHKAGLAYLHQCLSDYYLYFFLAPPLFVALKKRRLSAQQVILSGYVLVYSIWVVAAGSDYKPLYRHLAPLFPVMYAFALSVLAPAASARGRSTTVMLSSYVAVFSAGILLFSSVKWYFEDTEDAFFLNRLKKLSAAPEAYLQLCLARITEPEKYDYNGNLDTQVLLGKFIRDNYQKGTVFVYDQMGRVPYIAGTDYYFIDSLGLTDRTIGRFEFYARSNFVLRLYEKISRGIIAGVFPDAAGYGFTPGELVEYTFSKKPDVLMCLSFVRSALINTIAADERFKEGYRLHCLLHAVLVIERKGLLKKPFNVPAGLPVLFPQDILRDPYLSGHPWVAPFVKDDAVRPEEQARQN